jgi:hypothetical protein
MYVSTTRPSMLIGWFGWKAHVSKIGYPVHKVRTVVGTRHSPRLYFIGISESPSLHPPTFLETVSVPNLAESKMLPCDCRAYFRLAAPACLQPLCPLLGPVLTMDSTPCPPLTLTLHTDSTRKAANPCGLWN